MEWKLIIYAIVLIFPTVFSLNDVTRIKRSEDEDTDTQCGEGWHYFRQKCYKLDGETYHTLKSWNDAAHNCATNYGGHLVSINSKEELDFLVTYILLEFKYAVWIGLHKKAKGSEFSWHDGSPFNYTNWMAGEPTMGQYGEECVQMLYNHPNREDSVLGEWNDEKCTAKYSYVCQKKIVDHCIEKCGNNSDVECTGDKYDEQSVECKCKQLNNTFEEEIKECREDYCIVKCGNNSDVECTGNKSDEQSVECKCKQLNNVFDEEKKECRVDYCLSKCGKNLDIKCIGDRFDENDIECKCNRDGHMFDEDRKECRVDYCIEKCGEDLGVVCLNRFDAGAIRCKCISNGYSFNEESKECKVDYCIAKCGNKSDVECIGNRFANGSTIECNCRRNDHWFDEKTKDCRDLNIENEGLVSNTSACDKNENYYSCMPICNTCDNHMNGTLCYIICKPGCFCKEGFVKRAGGECVLPSQCSNNTGHKYLYPLIGVSACLIIVLLILAVVVCYFRHKQRFKGSDERSLWLSDIPERKETY